MTESEKSELLDDLAIAILRSGDIELSLSLEEYDQFRSDIRWQKTSECLRQVGVPKGLEVFCEEEPNWQGAKQSLRDLENPLS